MRGRPITHIPFWDDVESEGIAPLTNPTRIRPRTRNCEARLPAGRGRDKDPT